MPNPRRDVCPDDVCPITSILVLSAGYAELGVEWIRRAHDAAALILGRFLDDHPADESERVLFRHLRQAAPEGAEGEAFYGYACSTIVAMVAVTDHNLTAVDEARAQVEP